MPIPGATRVDLGGRYLIPGLIDAHHHLSFAALQPRWADLTHAGSPDDVFAALRDARRPRALGGLDSWLQLATDRRRQGHPAGS